MKDRACRALAILGVILASLIAGTAQADWQISDDAPYVPDGIEAAWIENAGGYSLALYRTEDHEIRIVLGLPDKGPDQFGEYGTLALLYVDQDDPYVVSILRDYPTEVERSEKSVSDRLWRGYQPPLSGPLRRILDGTQMRVYLRYASATGTTVTFPLGDEAAEMILSAIELVDVYDPKEIRLERDVDEEFSALLASCEYLLGDPAVACIRALQDCIEAIEIRAPGRYTACLTERGYVFD